MPIVSSSSPMKKTAAPSKASENLKARIAPSLKEQLQIVLAGHPDFDGNISAFIAECAKAAVLHDRRGERIAYPVQFLVIPKSL